jgi:hypothetical protein
MAIVQFIAGSALAGSVGHKDCVCRANHKKYVQGQVLCLYGKLARCEMYSNNPSWKIIGQSCLQTNLRYSPIALAFRKAPMLH